MKASLSGKVTRLAHELRFAFGAKNVADKRFTLSALDAAAPFFRDHGWVIVRHVFSTDEVEAMRQQVLKSEAGRLSGDLLSNSYLSHVVIDDRVLRIASALLGGQPTYFGDSSWHSSDGDVTGIGFHKDNANKFNQHGPDWSGEYPILRMGIYLQDHVGHSGGLALRDRSHTTTDTLFGQPFAAPTAKGDVVVWSLRTSHSGYVSRPRLFPEVFLPLTVQKGLATIGTTKVRLSRVLFLPMEYPQRLALFMSFGIDGNHVRRYVEYLKTRRYAVEIWQHSRYTDSIRTELRKRALGLIEVPPQVAHIDPRSIAESHQEPV